MQIAIDLRNQFVALPYRLRVLARALAAVRVDFGHGDFDRVARSIHVVAELLGGIVLLNEIDQHFFRAEVVFNLVFFFARITHLGLFPILGGFVRVDQGNDDGLPFGERLVRGFDYGWSLQGRDEDTEEPELRRIELRHGARLLPAAAVGDGVDGVLNVIEDGLPRPRRCPVDLFLLGSEYVLLLVVGDSLVAQGA